MGSLPQLSQLQSYLLLLLKSVKIPSQHFLHHYHHLLSVRQVHWLLFIYCHILPPQRQLEVLILLVSPVEVVDPSGEVADHVHVRQQLLPLLSVVLQSQQQLVNPAHIGILLNRDIINKGLQSVGEFHSVFIEGKNNQMKE